MLKIVLRFIQFFIEMPFFMAGFIFAQISCAFEVGKKVGDRVGLKYALWLSNNEGDA